MAKRCPDISMALKTTQTGKRLTFETDSSGLYVLICQDTEVFSGTEAVKIYGVTYRVTAIGAKAFAVNSEGLTFGGRFIFSILK